MNTKTTAVAAAAVLAICAVPAFSQYAVSQHSASNSAGTHVYAESMSTPAAARAARNRLKLGLTGAVPKATDAQKNDHWYISKGSVCSDKFPGVNGRYLRATFKIHAGPTKNTHVAYSVDLRGRLIPQGDPGIHLDRSWRKRITPLLGTGGWTFFTQIYIPITDDDLQFDQDLQVKIVWNRTNPHRDWTNSLYIPFNEPNCPGYADATGGGGGGGGPIGGATTIGVG